MIQLPTFPPERRPKAEDLMLGIITPQMWPQVVPWVVTQHQWFTCSSSTSPRRNSSAEKWGSKYHLPLGH